MGPQLANTYIINENKIHAHRAKHCCCVDSFPHMLIENMSLFGFFSKNPLADAAKDANGKFLGQRLHFRSAHIFVAVSGILAAAREKLYRESNTKILKEKISKIP